jgi:hypothetical protein
MQQSAVTGGDAIATDAGNSFFRNRDIGECSENKRNHEFLRIVAGITGAN